VFAGLVATLRGRRAGQDERCKEHAGREHGQAPADRGGPAGRRLTMGWRGGPARSPVYLTARTSTRWISGSLASRSGPTWARARGISPPRCVSRASSLSKRVEDAVGRVLELERVPRHGALLGGDDRAAALEEGREIRALLGFASRRASTPTVTAMSTPFVDGRACLISGQRPSPSTGARGRASRLCARAEHQTATLPPSACTTAP